MGYELTWEPRGVIKTFYGEVSGEDLIQSGVECESDSRFDDIRYVINDFLAITRVAIEVPHVEYLAGIDYAAAISNPRILVAVVTTAAQIEALTEHYVATLGGAYVTKIFPTMDEARKWIQQTMGL